MQINERTDNLDKNKHKSGNDEIAHDLILRVTFH